MRGTERQRPPGKKHHCRLCSPHRERRATELFSYLLSKVRWRVCGCESVEWDCRVMKSVRIVVQNAGDGMKAASRNGSGNGTELGILCGLPMDPEPPLKMSLKGLTAVYA
jgi:hypothetical protein